MPSVSLDLLAVGLTRRRGPLLRRAPRPERIRCPDVPYRSRSALPAGLKSQADLRSELNLLGRTADAQPPLAARWIGLCDEKHEPGGHQPERPGDVGDRDDRARKFPALLLERADELEGADDEG